MSNIGMRVQSNFTFEEVRAFMEKIDYLSLGVAVDFEDEVQIFKIEKIMSIPQVLQEKIE